MSKYVDGVNETNMDLFLAALRSGDYNQAEGRLCDTSYETGEVAGYCCLGVGSELLHRIDPELVLKTTDNNKRVYYNGARLLAPEAFVDWLGIPEANRSADQPAEGFNILFLRTHPQVVEEYPWLYGMELNKDEDASISASGLNDDFHFGFDTIADIFEAEFKREEN